MNRKLAAIAVALAVTACTTAQLETAQRYQDKIAGACKVAIGLAIYLPTVEPWIVGGCATEAAIAKLALDPLSLEWLADLVKKAKAIRG